MPSSRQLGEVHVFPAIELYNLLADRYIRNRPRFRVIDQAFSSSYTREAIWATTLIRYVLSSEINNTKKFRAQRMAYDSVLTDF